jgi:hypothetical protein
MDILCYHDLKHIRSSKLVDPHFIDINGNVNVFIIRGFATNKLFIKVLRYITSNKNKTIFSLWNTANSWPLKFLKKGNFFTIKCIGVGDEIYVLETLGVVLERSLKKSTPWANCVIISLPLNKTTIDYILFKGKTHLLF